MAIRILKLPHGTKILAPDGLCRAGKLYFYTVVLQHILLALGWALFGVFHSVLASGAVKRALFGHWPRLRPYYRTLYVLFAFATMGAVLTWQLRIPSPLLLGSAWRYPGFLLAGAGLGLMVVCIKKYFLSLSGLKSLFQHREVAPTLRIDGVHRYIRHPLYLGTFVFIWGLFLIFPYGSLLVANIFIQAYTVLAIPFEEAKLIQDFGPDYERYKREVPRLIPRFWK
jgi:protein-S-isoprenylcysteine O-methyltransferase Ste14